MSQCFKDTNLLSRRECEDARLFINAVHDYFLLNDDRLATAFNTEDQALQNAEFFLRESRTRQELEQYKKQATIDEKDPTLFERDKMEPLGAGEFQRDKMWGDANRAIQVGTEGEWKLPVLIVKRSGTRDHYLRALRIKRAAIDADTATSELIELAKTLAAKYPGWKFLY